MARIGRNGFLAVAVVFHLMYIYSIFDIYFVSPIVSGMKAYRVDGYEAPAQRLVLFVGDGLRADKAFQSFPDPSPSTANSTDSEIPRPLAPFLRSRVLEHGTFGVSHTRVPTESRPGHVALIAGLYEDVSSVTTGWKLNPVNFDSVFNRSRHTWSWGSPDILPMFKEGAEPGRVYADTYAAEAEDFTADATHLDTWVFDKVKALFKEAELDRRLNEELKQDQNVFFLHLLGLDTTGHAYRPYSKEYLHNIKVVDQGVEEITSLVNDFFGDDKTAFVFTADHGMSDWGSHGDGHPDNTRTPLIAWGSGVATPASVQKGQALGHEDGFSSDWGLDHIQRHDVAQADVATLMAYLVGIEYPVNSVGELPLSYLATDESHKAWAMLTNAKEILEMYRVKEEKKKAAKIRFVPYRPLSSGNNTANQRVMRIESLIQQGQFRGAIAASTELIKIALDGMRYLQTYDWLFLRALVTTGYLGWIAFASTTVIDLHVLQSSTQAVRTPASLTFFSSVFVIICSVLFIQQSSWTYYAYAIFPVVFWEEVFARRSALSRGRKVLLASEHPGLLILKTLALIGILEALVQSYFVRELYTIMYMAAIIWPVLYGPNFIQDNFALICNWIFCCLAMAIFTLLPAIKTENLTLILVGGGLMVAVGLAYLISQSSLSTSEESVSAQMQPKLDARSQTLIGLQVGLVALAMFVTASSVTSLQARNGLPLGEQVVGWLVLATSLLLPLAHNLQANNHYLHRLAVIFLAFAPSFIILTISYEGLFYLAFCSTVLSWVHLEHRVYTFYNTDQPDSASLNKLNPLKPAFAAASHRMQVLEKGDYRSLTLSDVRIAVFFMYLLQSAFFSTGNIASVSSFSLDAVYRLLPVFDPFSQGALLMLKIMIPFAVISANLGILNRRIGVAPSALFMIVMAISDIMTLNFFYMVKDEGSWLDIGTTISHFCIASGLCVFVAALEFVSELFIRGVGFNEAQERIQQHPARKAVDGRANGSSKPTSKAP